MITEKQRPNYFEYDGLVLYGGVDIDPHRYSSERKPNYDYDMKRDLLELNHFTYALHNKIPTLGICRGAQMINILLGGNLFTDIRKVDETTHYPNNIIGYLFFRKKITIMQNSNIANIFGLDSIKVNSIHKQSIDRLGKSLTVTAKEKNNIVQVIEHQEHPFMMGVQFHPEFMLYSKYFRGIFSALIEKAKG